MVGFSLTRSMTMGRRARSRCGSSLASGGGRRVEEEVAGGEEVWGEGVREEVGTEGTITGSSKGGGIWSVEGERGGVPMELQFSKEGVGKDEVEGWTKGLECNSRVGG